MKFREQHLMSRAAQQTRVYFVNPPLAGSDTSNWQFEHDQENITVATPFTKSIEEVRIDEEMQLLIPGLIPKLDRESYILWYCEPRAINWTEDLTPLVSVYDCTKQSSSANPNVAAWEEELLKTVDLVFTSGQTLYCAKFPQHPHVYSFPNRANSEDFIAARKECHEPADQKGIPKPRLGYFGKIDERIDYELIKEMCDLRQQWQFVFIGPVEVPEQQLPQSDNLHFLGPKKYEDLPPYVAGWSVALIPFVDNENTKYLTPEKAPEYLAAGVPVVSTPIPDMVRPYSVKRLVRIAGSAEEFITSCEMSMDSGHPVDQEAIDEFLKHTSWEETWAKMHELISDMIRLKTTGSCKEGMDRDFRDIGGRLGTHI